MAQLDRRKFIARTGIGAAAAGSLWLAPEILKPTSAFAGSSCLLTGSTLKASGSNPQWTVFSWALSGSYPAVQLLYSSTNIGAPSPNTGSGTLTAPVLTGYGIPNQRVFYYDFDDADLGEGGAVTFKFRNLADTADVPVYTVKFRVYDIDRNTTGGQNYIDRVQVVANAGVTVAAVGVGGSPSGSGTAGSPLIGTTTDNTSTTASYADYTLTGPVTSFTLQYTNSAGGDGTRMIVGIGDLNFCR